MLAAHLGETLLFLVLGGIVGFLGGVFGIGGGLIAIPLLALFFHLSEQVAQGTSLAMVVPNVIVGVRSYAQQRGFDRRVAVLMASAAAPATFVGAYVAIHVASSPLRIGFASFLLAISVVFAARALGGGAAAPVPWPRWTTVFIGAAGGVLSGTFSVGGAVFAVPLLATFYGFSQAGAQGVALALVAPGTFVSILTYAFAGDVQWSIGIPLAIGGLFCVRPGVIVAHRLPETTLRLSFCVLLIASAAALYVKR